MIAIKDSVRFKRIPSEMMKVLSSIPDVWGSYAPDVIPTITSANDSTHMVNSYHYIDFAYDVRSKNLSQTQKDTILVKLRDALGSGYDVILEGRGAENEHFHVEWNARQHNG